MRVHDRQLGELRLSLGHAQGNLYVPPSEIESEIRRMWSSRRPEVVGLTSEKLARDLLDGATLSLEKRVWSLTCVPIRNLPNYREDWIPKVGLRSDDLMMIGTLGRRRLYFPTEVKGSISVGGVSRSAQAKMFYQLPETIATRRKRNPSDAVPLLGGAVSVVVEHFNRLIVINVVPIAAILLTPARLEKNGHP